MRKIFSVLISVVLLISCSGEVNPYQTYEPYCIFTPYVTSNGTETAFASVMLMTADAEIPEKCYINGLIYDVVIFDGFSSSADAGKLNEIKLPSFITAISSHAYEQADKVKSVILPENISSLGSSCLPKNLTELTVPAEAICQTQTSTLYNALSTPETLAFLSITGTSRSTVDLRAFGNGNSKLESISLYGENATWPILPEMKMEGKVFLGWYTENPNENENALRAVPGEKPAYDGMTVHPYWKDENGETDKDDIPVEGISIYKIYCFGISEDEVSVVYDEDVKEYIIKINTSDWFWEWVVNGRKVLQENTNTLNYRKIGGSRDQIICYQCNAAGEPAGGAVMIEL